MVNKELLGKIRNKLHQAEDILITTHIRPDGDAIGSLVGLGLSLQELGKKIQMVSEDGVPRSLQFLTQDLKIAHSEQTAHQLSIVLDCSEFDRSGSVLTGQPDINIDHHVTNSEFAKDNLVEVESAATCEILAKYMPAWGLPITPRVANALLTGVVTDTIGFRTSSVTPSTLKAAAMLVEHGGNLAKIYQVSLDGRTYEAARFWGAGLNHLQQEDGLVWTVLSLEDRRAAGYPGNDDADLVNMLSTIESARIAVIFVEQADGNVKISWRAQSEWDVSAIAVKFGGGGHAAASGAIIRAENSMDEVIDQVLDATKKLLWRKIVDEKSGEVKELKNGDRK
jgi:phosphoesterase RecJ-like protein